MQLTKIVEALLFSYQEPLSVEHMTRAIRETAREIFDNARDDAEATAAAPYIKVLEKDVKAAITTLLQHYETDGHSFTLIERATGWRLCAKPEFADWSRALYPEKRTPRLSQAALETLAIIAYRQPITKAAIEAVRGVAVDTLVQQLIDRGLVYVHGRSTLPGKPTLYATTERFLDHFGVREVADLPNAQELQRVPLPEPAPPAQGAKTKSSKKKTASSVKADPAPLDITAEAAQPDPTPTAE
jgi:segregation and condensation protein B